MPHAKPVFTTQTETKKNEQPKGLSETDIQEAAEIVAHRAAQAGAEAATAAAKEVLEEAAGRENEMDRQIKEIEDRRIRMQEESERRNQIAEANFQVNKDATDLRISALLNTFTELQNDLKRIEKAQNDRIDALERTLNNRFNTIMTSLDTLNKNAASAAKGSDAESEKSKSPPPRRQNVTDPTNVGRERTPPRGRTVDVRTVKND